MKKSAFFPLFLLMLSLASYAQNNYICQPDTILIYTNHLYIESDSMFFFNTYNDEGLFIQSRAHYDDDDFKKTPDIPPIQSKTDYEYDSNHNNTKTTTHLYCTPRPYSKVGDYTYQDDKLVLYTNRYIDFLGDSRTDDSVLYLYDAMGRIQEEVAYTIHGIELVYGKHVVYAYDDNTIEITTEGLENGSWGAWVQLNKETKTYSEDNLLINVVTEPYGSLSTSETYSYDEESRVSSVLRKVLDSTGWINRRLLEYNYDLSGHLTLAEIKAWQDDSFVNAFRAIYELNEAGYPAVVTFERWNGGEWEQGTWQPGFYIFSEDYLERQNNKVCRKDAKKILIQYANTNLPNYDVEDHQGALDFCTLHPNPTNGQVTITGKNLKQAEVFNTLGQCVATARGEGEQMTVDLSALPAGVYFVNITDKDGRKCVRKVVKE